VALLAHRQPSDWRGCKKYHGSRENLDADAAAGLARRMGCSENLSFYRNVFCLEWLRPPESDRRRRLDRSRYKQACVKLVGPAAGT
jgi:hypothetical protein